MDKAQLLAEMNSKYAELESLLASLNEQQMTTPGVSGDWSIKDILAHITTWQQSMLERLQAVARNVTPAFYGPDNDEEMDRMNARFYQENKARPLSEVLSNFSTSHRQVVEMVQTLQDEDLFDPNRFTWRRGSPLWDLVAGDTYEHYDEHMQSIQQWLAPAGNV